MKSFWTGAWPPLVLILIAGIIVTLFYLTAGQWRSGAIEPMVKEWSAGPLRIIDVRTGTEINRIILGPDKQMIAERVYIDWSGEEEVRRIGR
jgi:hypothetical protein